MTSTEVQCSCCGQEYDAFTDRCPECGAVNAELKQYVEYAPKTIDGLKAFCERMGIDAERMRIFIDIDHDLPMIYGIYRESGAVVLYRNKMHGERVIKYYGTDETYAVGLLYGKLKEELMQRQRVRHFMETARSEAELEPFSVQLRRSIVKVLVPVIKTGRSIKQSWADRKEEFENRAHRKEFV